MVNDGAVVLDAESYLRLHVARQRLELTQLRAQRDELMALQALRAECERHGIPVGGRLHFDDDACTVRVES